MPITEADIEKLARLAQLELSADEGHALAPQLDSIVRYVEQLNELDTSNVEPAIGGLKLDGDATVTTAMRDDEERESLGQQLALDQAPETTSNYFRVPKVIGGG